MFEQITAPFVAVWEAIVEFFTLFPIWLEWLPLGIGIILLCFVVAWFFPIARSLAGAIVLATVGVLYGYAKGMKETAARYKKKIDQLKQQKSQSPPQQTNPFDWWRR